MSRLQQIKDEYAIQNHAHDWICFIDNQVHWWIDIQMDEVCKIYAKECMENALKLASESATVFEVDWDTNIVDKGSILNESNIVLL